MKIEDVESFQRIGWWLDTETVKSVMSLLGADVGYPGNVTGVKDISN